MAQYILIAKPVEGKKTQFEGYRVIEFDRDKKLEDQIPVGYERILGPAGLEDVTQEIVALGADASKWRNLTYLQYFLIFAVTGAFMILIYLGISRKFESNEEARGLITYLIAVGTIGIATLAILAAMLLRDFKERFDSAKQVLTILVGILGTIVGFYYGQAAEGRGERNREDRSAELSVSGANFAPNPLSRNRNANVSFNISGGESPYSYRISIPEASANIEGNTRTGEVRQSFNVNAATNVNAANYSIEVSDSENRRVTRSSDAGNKIQIQ